MKNDTIDFMELKWSNNGIPYKNNEKVFTGYTGPFPKATGHEFDGLKKALEQDEKLWRDMKDKVIDIVKEWEPNLILELIGAPYIVKDDEKPCKEVKDMDFDLRVKAFKKELDKLLKDYDLEMYSGWISTWDDEDIIIKDLKSNKEIYYSSIKDSETF